MTWMMLYVMGAFLSTALMMLLAVYAWRHREAAGGGGFAAMMACVAIWSIIAALEAISATAFAKDFWLNLKYITMASAPVAILIFALQLIRNRWLTRRRIFLLLIVPIITQIVIWTNPWHLWLNPLIGQPGVWFWVHSAYSFTMIFISMILVVLSLFGATPTRRRQLIALLVGISIPLVINVLHTFGILPYMADFTPLAFTFSGVLFAWTIYRHRLFDLTPLAREVVIDEMADGMLVLDENYRVVDNNPSVQAALNLSASNLYGMSATEIVPTWSELLATLSSSSLHHNELVLGEAANERHYEVYLSPLYDSQQDLAGYVLLLHDITVRKRAERVIHQYARELETRNVDLETRNAELDAFAHTVAHDLKNPLSGIIGFGSLLEQRFSSLPPEKALENIRRIVQISNKMFNIISELLLLSSVRKMEGMEFQPVDMQRVTTEALGRLEERIHEAQAEVLGVDNWPSVMGYAPWIEEVWVNYIGNALKYGGRPDTQTPPRVELGFSLLDSVTPEGSLPAVRFWVRDNGYGLSAEAQGKLFVEFTRLEQTRAKGHGLGLSIVRRIVEKLGGAVGVESAEGQGSTFWFTLPLDNSSLKLSS